MKKETCKFTSTNEYVKRVLNADNGLWNALVSMKNGDREMYKEYCKKIAIGPVSNEEKARWQSAADFWEKEAHSAQKISSKNYPNIEDPINLPRAGLHKTAGAGKSMNLDHSKLTDGDVFLIDGNHRTTAAMIRGEEPIVMFDDRINLSPEWKEVIEAKTDRLYRVKHQPHPHPLLWDLNSYRTMESCEERYGALVKNGIKSTYEIGCAEGVGVWILRRLGVDANGGEQNGPARTLAKSLVKGTIDARVSPSLLPQTECLVMYSVLYHLLGDSLKKDEWLQKIKQQPCVALELSTTEENKTKDRYKHMINYNPLEWWPNRKLLYVDHKQAGRETWLLWK